MATDEQAFTALYRRHYADIEGYVRRRLPADAVRDVVAEVFLVAWRRFDVVPDDAALPWLYAVARNVVANEARRSRRALALRERVEREPGTDTTDPTGELAERIALAGVFDSLPAKSQEILRLVAWEQLSVSEAARVVGCSVPAATMRLHRARQHARDALAGRDPSREKEHRP